MLLKTSTVEDSSTFENYTQYLCCFHIAGTMGLGKKKHVAGCLALLLDESEAYRLLEGPRKKVVLLGTHHNEKQRNVSALTDPVTIEVGTNTHSIAVGAGVEWWRVKVTVHIISEMPVNIRNLPTSIPFLVLTSRTSSRSRIYFINSNYWFS